MSAAHAIVTHEAACSISECCRSWSASAHSKVTAALMLRDALERAGAVGAELGVRDAEGHSLRSVFCRECWAGLRAALQGAA